MAVWFVEDMEPAVSTMPEPIADRSLHHDPLGVMSMSFNDDHLHSVHPGFGHRTKHLALRVFNVAFEQINALTAKAVQNFGQGHSSDCGAFCSKCTGSRTWSLLIVQTKRAIR